MARNNRERLFVIVVFVNNFKSIFVFSVFILYIYIFKKLLYFLKKNFSFFLKLKSFFLKNRCQIFTNFNKRKLKEKI